MRKRTRKEASPFDAVLERMRVATRLDHVNHELANAANVERRLHFEGRDPAAYFAQLHRLREELGDSVGRDDAERALGRKVDKRGVIVPFWPGVGQRRQARQACGVDRHAWAQMDTLTRRSAPPPTASELFNGPQFGILRFQTAFDAPDWIVAWEGQYETQITPHACRVQLTTGLRVMARLAVSSTTVSAPVIRVFAVVLLQPDVLQPPPVVGLILNTEQLVDLGTGQLVNHGMLRVLGRIEQSGGSFTFEREFLLAVQVAPGAQSRAWLAFGVAVAQGPGLVSISGDMIAYWPETSSYWGGTMGYTQWVLP